MKKILTLAVAAILTASFAIAAPAKKDKKNKKSCCTEQMAPCSLLSKSDSLSYAAGMHTTNGLMEYVGREYGVDSTGVQAFVEGLREGIAKQSDKQFMARVAGLQIAQMLEKRIYPSVASQVKNTPWTLDSITFNRAFIAAVLGDTTVMKTADASKYFEKTMTDEKRRQEEAYKAENVEWLTANAKKEGVKTLPSGLQYKVLTAGTGEVAGKDDNVTVRYEGKTIDGNVFDSSYKRNPNTTTFRPDQVIKGWTEALTMMPVGSTWELYIPQELAYGSRAAGSIKPYSTLIFKVELVKVDRKKVEESASDKKSDTKAAVKTLVKGKKAAAKKAKK